MDAHYETENARLSLKDGIFYSEYSPIHVSLTIAKECVEARLKLSEGKSYPLLSDIRAVKSMNRGVREYLSKGDGEKLVSACAIIVGSEMSKFMGNAFLLVNKPAVPVKVFTSEEKAIAWLSIYK